MWERLPINWEHTGHDQGFLSSSGQDPRVTFISENIQLSLIASGQFDAGTDNLILKKSTRQMAKTGILTVARIKMDYT